ncbi:uncharacterized protein LOC126882413 [Diabrotica virgifera virgifera]|uniref:Uncharacterized protein n=1 Tax=Diabrotica virgifera virgifera TaxID=50390 RepID=A0ABM5JZF5_DIAVI|nr:uncharacterized protein LOC126882413 [Diabrotica virgifera virgifera]
MSTIEIELLNLSKSDLVSIIINKKVSDNIKISNELADFLANKSGSIEMTTQTPCEDIRFLLLNCELTVAKCEIKANKRVMAEMEKSSKHQDHIAKLLTGNIQTLKEEALKARNEAASRKTYSTTNNITDAMQYNNISSGASEDVRKVALLGDGTDQSGATSAQPEAAAAKPKKGGFLSKLTSKLPLGKLPLPAGGLPAGLPTGGLPAGGVPAGGLPAGGLPAGGLPAGSLPTGGLPAGLPAENLPSESLPTPPATVPKV